MQACESELMAEGATSTCFEDSLSVEAVVSLRGQADRETVRGRIAIHSLEPGRDDSNRHV